MTKIGHNRGPVFSRDSGWVAIARSMRGHPLVGFHLFARPCDPSKGAIQPALAFIDLIMECRWENGTVMNGGKRMEIKRGQLVGAVSWLAARWNWTPMAVRTWLEKLETDEMISRHVPGADSNKHKGKVATIITLCNYDTYQSATANDQPTEQQTNSKQATNEQQTNNNIYKDKHLNKETREQDNYAAGAPRDLCALEAKLLGACNGALDNPVNCQGLLSLATPIMWLDQGADLDRDVIPTLVALGKRLHGKRIRTWDYFTAAVAEAKATREAGLPNAEPNRKRTGPVGLAAQIRAHKERENSNKMGG